jgi:hypothetical protein
MFEEKNRAVFDRSKAAFDRDQKPLDCPSRCERAEQDDAGQKGDGSFAYWIAQGYLPG